MIQILTYSGTEEELKGEKVTINKLHDARSLDEFEINIFDFKSENIWENSSASKQICNILSDLKSLNTMIRNSKKAKKIIFLPQNIEFKYNYGYSPRGGQDYLNSCELKNMIRDMKIILSYMCNSITELDISYENPTTIISESGISASFCFNDVADGAVLTQSVISEKITTIKCNDVILSTLNISSYKDMISFLKQIHLIEDKEQIPAWLKEEKMFDDEKQLQIIDEKQSIIKKANDDIGKAMEVIHRNERYKSILYTSGDELVEVVFEIIEQIMGCDLSEFIDKKKEDFNFQIGEKIFIGEIKGITPNVKKANVSQLDVHVQEYLDENDCDIDNIVSLLVINHQRTKPLKDRDIVHGEQIKLAQRNGSLIVETVTLLKMFEQFLSGQISKKECIDMFINEKGLLKI